MSLGMLWGCALKQGCWEVEIDMGKWLTLVL